jgi:hypothetical protein
LYAVAVFPRPIGESEPYSEHFICVKFYALLIPVSIQKSLPNKEKPEEEAVLPDTHAEAL